MKSFKQHIAEKHVGFAAVEASARKSGARNPAAVAAAVGIKKYGKAKMMKAAHEGKPIKEAQSVTAALKQRAAKLAQPAKKVAPKGPYSTKNASAGSFERTGTSIKEAKKDPTPSLFQRNAMKPAEKIAAMNKRNRLRMAGHRHDEQGYPMTTKLKEEMLTEARDMNAADHENAYWHHFEKHCDSYDCGDHDKMHMHGEAADHHAEMYHALTGKKIRNPGGLGGSHVEG